MSVCRYVGVSVCMRVFMCVYLCMNAMYECIYVFIFVYMLCVFFLPSFGVHPRSDSNLCA